MGEKGRGGGFGDKYSSVLGRRGIWQDGLFVDI